MVRRYLKNTLNKVDAAVAEASGTWRIGYFGHQVGDGKPAGSQALRPAICKKQLQAASQAGAATGGSRVVPPGSADDVVDAEVVDDGRDSDGRNQKPDGNSGEAGNRH